MSHEHDKACPSCSTWIDEDSTDCFRCGFSYHKLKPLVWTQNKWKTGWIATTIFGDYIVDNESWMHPDTDTAMPADSMEHAQALSWADYERRVAELYE